VAAFLRDRTVARRLGVALGLAAVVVTVVLLQVGARVPTTEAVQDPTSVVARTQLWSAGWDAFAGAPFGGVGLDGFLAASRDAGVAAPHEHAHNLLLHAAATTGVPGLLAVVAVWGGIAVGAWQLLDRARTHAVLVGLAGLGAMAMVDELALRPSTTGLLALLVVTVAAPRDPALLR
jgi:O-antigen ligase